MEKKNTKKLQKLGKEIENIHAEHESHNQLNFLPHELAARVK